MSYRFDSKVWNCQNQTNDSTLRYTEFAIYVIACQPFEQTNSESVQLQPGWSVKGSQWPDHQLSVCLSSSTLAVSSRQPTLLGCHGRNEDTISYAYRIRKVIDESI